MPLQFHPLEEPHQAEAPSPASPSGRLARVLLYLLMLALLAGGLSAYLLGFHGFFHDTDQMYRSISGPHPMHYQMLGEQMLHMLESETGRIGGQEVGIGGFCL